MVHVSDLLPHPHQAAGHPGTLLISPDGTKVAKPALQREIDFYESFARRLEAKVGGRDGWRPRYYGVVEGTRSDSKSPLILIENLTAECPTAGGFVRPTVIDLKLGTQMWDPDSSDDKRERMERVAKNTTSGRWGVRITGGKVWDATAQEYVTIGKEVGKSLEPDGSALLPTLARFFPTSDPSSFQSAIPLTQMAQLLRSHIIPGVKSVLEVVKQFDWRVYGSSLLVVYEGDPLALQQRLAEGSQEPAAKVKMIDFAHAWEGEAPDQGLLKGFETVLDLLEKLEAQVTKQ